MLYLEARHKKIVLEILAKYPFQFYAFGSRVKGNHRKFSDLDICTKNNIPEVTLAHIQADFEGSDLPFKVDVVALSKCSKRFRQEIEGGKLEEL